MLTKKSDARKGVFVAYTSLTSVRVPNSLDICPKGPFRVNTVSNNRIYRYSKFSIKRADPSRHRRRLQSNVASRGAPHETHPSEPRRLPASTHVDLGHTAQNPDLSQNRRGARLGRNPRVQRHHTQHLCPDKHVPQSTRAR